LLSEAQGDELKILPHQPSVSRQQAEVTLHGAGQRMVARRLQQDLPERGGTAADGEQHGRRRRGAAGGPGPEVAVFAEVALGFLQTLNQAGLLRFAIDHRPLIDFRAGHTDGDGGGVSHATELRGQPFEHLMGIVQAQQRPLERLQLFEPTGLQAGPILRRVFIFPAGGSGGQFLQDEAKLGDADRHVGFEDDLFDHAPGGAALLRADLSAPSLLGQALAGAPRARHVGG
jgi:hypothetical protein